MSSELFEFHSPDRFVIGTVGAPGERAFYLQVKKADLLRSFGLEKSQASALAERAAELLREIDLRFERLPEDSHPLDTPIEPDFSLGLISLTWRSDDRMVMFEGQELRLDESEGAEESSLSMLRVHLTPEQLSSFISRTRSVVQAGRQPCIFCGGPLDVTGHLCPRANGYRRQP